MNIETFIQNDWANNPTEMVRIDFGNNTFTVMDKSTYDEQQAAQATLVTESAPTV